MTTGFRATTRAMTVPSIYVHASRDYERFLLDARDALGLGMAHQTYAAALAVLVTFADALPPLLGAMLLRDWPDPGKSDAAPRKAFADRATLTREAQRYRPNHTLLPESGIADIARALRRHVDTAAFARALQRLPEGAVAFWEAGEPGAAADDVIPSPLGGEGGSAKR
jgi:uncharacterized protein (DUF2267 family)